MAKTRLFLLPALILTCAACSGGGGGSDDDSFSGDWHGTLTLVEKSPETCNADLLLDQTYSITHTDDEIEVTVDDQLELTGSANSNSSFDVGTSAGSGLSPTSFTLTFTNAADGRATATFTSFQGSFTAESGLEGCTRTWEGEVEKD